MKSVKELFKAQIIALFLLQWYLCVVPMRGFYALWLVHFKCLGVFLMKKTIFLQLTTQKTRPLYSESIYHMQDTALSPYMSYCLL